MRQRSGSAAASVLLVAVMSACSPSAPYGGGTVLGDAVGGDAKLGDTTASDSAPHDATKTDSTTADGATSPDAGITPELIQQCWEDNCAKEISACASSATCQGALTCAFACPKTDSVCPNKCADPLKSDLTAAVAFATLAKCAKSHCSFSTLPANTCGNGQCEGDENQWCSMDCDTTIGPLADCTTGKCSADACLLDEACNKGLNCVLECTDPSCWSGCQPAGATSADLWNTVWGCVQVDCGVYLPQGG